MKLKNPFKDLSRFELILWLFSVLSISVLFFFLSSKDYLTLIASLIGVTALIFTAKGYVLGQVLIVVFAVLYGIVSFYFKYYGEVITYLGMSSPIAVFTIISWIRHPYKKTSEVKISSMTKRQVIIMLALASIVTFVFYYILKALDTSNLIMSTVSVSTSFVAAYCAFKRSSFYAVGYALNDIVLIILWVLAAIQDISYTAMIACFVIFLINDLYGFYNWQRIKKRQSGQ